MQINLLKNLVEQMAGQGAGKIVDILFDKSDINEFLIAKKMDLTINQVRNILYKLSAEGLVVFTRKKDKRKGWYIYFWTLNSEKCLLKLELELVKRLSELKGLLNLRETKRYYLCKNCNIEVTEEVALEHDFACEECAEIYTLLDNTLHINDLKLKIAKNEKALEEIRSELEQEREKNSKKIAKENTRRNAKNEKAKKQLKQERAEKKKLKNPIKEKEKKASVKKASKKIIKKK
jgi:transcription factor E